MVAGVLQKYPAGHGDVEIDEAGQKAPCVHAVFVSGLTQ